MKVPKGQSTQKWPWMKLERQPGPILQGLTECLMRSCALRIVGSHQNLWTEVSSEVRQSDFKSSSVLKYMVNDITEKDKIHAITYIRAADGQVPVYSYNCEQANAYHSKKDIQSSINLKNKSLTVHHSKTLLWNISIFIVYIWCVCMHVCACEHVSAMAQVWRSEDSFWELVLSQNELGLSGLHSPNYL